MSKYITLTGLGHFLTQLKSDKFKATDSKYGAIKIGYNGGQADNTNKKYPVQLDSNNKAFVNVPWVNTTYTIGLGIVNESSTGLKLNLKDFNKSTYEGQYTTPSNTNNFHSVCVGTLDNLAVSVPWTNNNVTSVDNHYLPAGKDQSNTSSKFYKISIDDAGHISSYSAVNKSDILSLGIADSDPVEIEDITYSSIKLLITNNNLIPGKKYCITDYTAVIRSDGSDGYYITHNTKNIVVTSAGNIFKIVVKALSNNKLSENAKIQFSGGYFNIKYSIDNDSSMFPWANATNGKGVIYYMEDENGNKAPYDFKNIKFDNKFTFYNSGNLSEDTSLGSSVNNNIIYYHPIGTGIYGLPYNLFLGTPCVGNIIGTGSTNNLINKSNNNIIGCDNSQLNIINSNHNIIGNNCDDINLKSANYNTIGNNCENVILGNLNNNHNVIGDNCSNITFGDESDHNTIGNNCKNSNFGKYCKYNIVDDNLSGSGIYFDKSITTTPQYVPLDRVENCTFNQMSGKINLTNFYPKAQGDITSKYFDSTTNNLSSSYKFNNMEFMCIGSAAVNSQYTNMNVNDVGINNILNRSTPTIIALDSCVIKKYFEINF